MVVGQPHWRGTLKESAVTESELEPEELQLYQTEVDEPQRPDLDENQRATLVRLLRVLYPHPQVPESPYERCAEAVIANAQTDLVAGLARLNQLAGGSFTDVDEAAARDLVDGLGEDPDLLLPVHAVSVTTLYDDHEVWDLLGYEGSSYEKGGYINRGFNDLDWLPDPRITEYDGDPRVENVPLASTGGN